MGKAHNIWSRGEVIILQRHYPWAGAAEVQRRLKAAGYPERNTRAITSKAYYEGIAFGSPRDYIALSSVHPAGEAYGAGAADAALTAARRDGVLRTTIGDHAPRRRHLVPIKWADEYMAKYSVKRDADRELKGLWPTTSEAAKVLGVTTSYLSAVRRDTDKRGHQALARFIEKIERREGRMCIYWEPRALREASLHYNAWRKNSRMARSSRTKNGLHLHTQLSQG